MRAALFGASGFLGDAVAAAMVAAGWTVERLGRPRVDVTDGRALAAVELDGAPDVVVNCAARVPTGPSTLDEHAAMSAVNAIGAGNVAQWAVARGARRLVHCSTLVVAARPWPVPLTEDAPTYPRGPATGYAASKLAGELVAGAIADAAQLSFVALRLSALYGPAMRWHGVLPAFVDAALAGRRLRAVRGAHADFLHLDDAARAVARAASIDAARGVMNLAAGEETSIVELARIVLRASGRPDDDLDVEDAATVRAVVDVERMRRVLGVTPAITLAAGVAQLVGRRRQGAEAG